MSVLCKMLLNKEKIGPNWLVWSFVYRVVYFVQILQDVDFSFTIPKDAPKSERWILL